jgi:GNAT superfamily N-acetyltransferase
MNTRVRPARPTDKGQLMSFIKKGWGGHDYIPRIWDRWLKDRTGKMFVVEADGVPVGMSRVEFLEDGSAWLEGARVHPDFRGRGLASMLGENSMRIALNRGVKVFRLTSRSWNKAAHRAIARIKFKESSRISPYEPGKRARFAPQKDVRLAGMDDLSRVARLIRESREFRLGSGVFWDAFTAVSLSPTLIRKLVSEGSVWIAGKSVAVARLGGEGGEAWRQVCFLTGKGDESVRLVRHVFGLKEGAKTTRRIVYLPQGSRQIGALRRAGFTRLTSLILFERETAKG